MCFVLVDVLVTILLVATHDVRSAYSLCLLMCSLTIGHCPVYLRGIVHPATCTAVYIHPPKTHCLHSQNLHQTAFSVSGHIAWNPILLHILMDAW